MSEQSLTIRIGAVVTGVREAILAIKTQLSGLSGVVAKAEAAFVLFNKVLLASVIGIIVIALINLVQVFRDNEKAMKKLEPLLIGLEKIGGGIYRAFEPVLNAFIELATSALPYLTKGIGILYSALYGLFTLVKQAGVGTGKLLKGIFTLDTKLINEGWDQLKNSVLVATLEAGKAFDRYEVGLTDMTKTEKKNLDKKNKDSEKAQKEAEQILRDTLEGRKKLLESELTGVSNLSDRYLTLKKAIAEVSTQLASIGQKGGNKERQQALANELKKITDEFKNQRFQAGTIDPSLLFTSDKSKLSELATTWASEFKAKFGEALKTAGQVNGKVEIIPSQSAQLAINAMDGIEQRVMKTTHAFNDFLAPAVDVVFGALANGANVFDALKQSLKAMVVQMGITIAKALVLSAILSAIGGPAAGAVIGGSGKGGIGKIFSTLLGKALGGSAAPNFGGISGGGLSGEVVFRQSGSDLVGVLARTNNRIGRVG